MGYITLRREKRNVYNLHNKLIIILMKMCEQIMTIVSNSGIQNSKYSEFAIL